MAASRAPFEAETWQLQTARGKAIELQPIDTPTAACLGAAVTGIDPWQRMGYSAPAMTAYFASRDSGTCRRVLRQDGAIIGAVSIRYPWLRGPYLELLALLPGSQGLGLGTTVLDWMRREVEGRANSLWVCTSTFNDRGLAFYERHGFSRVGDLDDLVGPGFTEILLRKRL